MAQAAAIGVDLGEKAVGQRCRAAAFHHRNPPFEDGNSRLSRVLATLPLRRNGYAYVPLISLECVIEANKEGYYLELPNKGILRRDRRPAAMRRRRMGVWDLPKNLICRRDLLVFADQCVWLSSGFAFASGHKLVMEPRVAALSGLFNTSQRAARQRWERVFPGQGAPASDTWYRPQPIRRECRSRPQPSESRAATASEHTPTAPGHRYR